MRTFGVLGLILLSACGGDATPTPAPSALRGGTPEADRRALSPAQLAAFLPAEIGGRRAALGSAQDYEHEWTSVFVHYLDAADGARNVDIEIRDLIDAPARVAEGRRQATEPSFAFEQGTGPDREDHRVLDDGTLVEEVEDESTSGRHDARLFLVVGDRFTVGLSPGRVRGRAAEPTLADLWAVYEASGLARLAGASVYAEAAPAEMPAWAAGGADAPARAVPPTPADALPPCDDVLPLAEVERVCGVSGLRRTPTAFVDEGPTACNRKYGVPRNLSGLYVIVTRFPDAARARAGQRLSGDIERPVDLRDVPGLGDAASRHVQNSEAGRTSDRVLSVAAGTDLVEMKSVVLPDEPDAEVCSLDQLETLARGVVARLTP